jgi:hypothetical protein
MCRFRRGPEIRDREARVEVCAEIVHPGDGEHDVHAELIFWVRWRWGWFVGGGGREGREGTDFEDFEVGAAHGGVDESFGG